MYDRNRIFGRNFRPNPAEIFGRNFRPTCRTFGQDKARKNEAKIKLLNIEFWVYDMIWYYFINRFYLKLLPKMITRFCVALKVIFCKNLHTSCLNIWTNFGRIFGRKFRPMWPNIRFRPKLVFPLSVVHYFCWWGM